MNEDPVAEAGVATICAILRRRSPGFDFRPLPASAGRACEGNVVALPVDRDPIAERDVPALAA